MYDFPDDKLDHLLSSVSTVDGDGFLHVRVSHERVQKVQGDGRVDEIKEKEKKPRENINFNLFDTFLLAYRRLIKNLLKRVERLTERARAVKRFSGRIKMNYTLL